MTQNNNIFLHTLFHAAKSPTRMHNAYLASWEHFKSTCVCVVMVAMYKGYVSDDESTEPTALNKLRKIESRTHNMLLLGHALLEMAS